MSTPVTDYSTLEFVRSATPKDSHVYPHGSLWQMPDSEDTIWLTPDRIIQEGLGDKLRAGVAGEQLASNASDLWAAVRAEASDPAQDIRDGAEKVAKAEPSLVLGGHTDVWRWQRVDDQIALDNRPALDAAVAAHREDPAIVVPEYQHVVVPIDVVEAIAGLHGSRRA